MGSAPFRTLALRTHRKSPPSLRGGGADEAIQHRIAALDRFASFAMTGAVRSTFHSGGFESVAHRIDAAEAEREAAILANRIKNKIPIPGSEEMLRRVIASLQNGNVDFTQFIDSLAARLQLGFAVVFEELVAKGAVETLAFRGVGPLGGDVYDVKFENENTEWRIGLAPDGKIRFLFWRSTP